MAANDPEAGRPGLARSDTCRRAGSTVSEASVANNGVPEIAVRMLGTFEVVRADGSVPAFRTQKTKWLFAYLLLQQGCVEFGRLKDIFWPGEGPGQTSA